jgi:hypothetical protein
MCNINTGLTVGWAAATVDCDGTTISIEYIDTSGTSQGSTKPSDWEYCRPGFSSQTIYSIVQITQAAYTALGTKDPNTLYVIVG